MNLNNIKASMETHAKAISIPNSVPQFNKSSMPIQVIRRRMTVELRTLFIAMFVSIFLPLIIEMASIPKAIYLCAIILSAIFNLGYMNKMRWFLNKNSSVTGSSRDTVIQFINDLENTLIVYKSASFVSSLILVIAAATLAFRKPPASQLIEKCLNLDLSGHQTLLVLLGMIFVIIAVRYIVNLSVKLVYGKNLIELKNVLLSLEE